MCLDLIGPAVQASSGVVMAPAGKGIAVVAVVPLRPISPAALMDACLIYAALARGPLVLA